MLFEFRINIDHVLDLLFFSCLATSVVDHVDNLILVLDVGVLNEFDELIPVRTEALSGEAAVLFVQFHFLDLVFDSLLSSRGTVVGQVVVE